MSYFTPDMYGQPEKFGLTIVGKIATEDTYEHDYFMLWHHAATGKFYAGQSAGCSCISPFESFTSLDEATEVENLGHLLKLTDEYVDESTNGWTEVEEVHQWRVQAVNLVQKYLELK